jgi:hypothetical protein
VVDPLSVFPLSFCSECGGRGPGSLRRLALRPDLFPIDKVYNVSWSLPSLPWSPGGEGSAACPLHIILLACAALICLVTHTPLPSSGKTYLCTVVVPPAAPRHGFKRLTWTRDHPRLQTGEGCQAPGYFSLWPRESPIPPRMSKSGVESNLRGWRG